MRALLQRAVAAIEQLPPDVQDAIATRLLVEAADEQAWAAQFEATTDVQWDRMAEGVRCAIAEGDSIPLDEPRHCRGQNVMIGTDEQFEIAQKCGRNLQRILLAARKVHDQNEYRSMAEPILTELQRRQQEILEYLRLVKSHISDASDKDDLI